MSAANTLRASIEAQLAEKIPQALTLRPTSTAGVLLTGIHVFDQQAGGIPCGALTEISGLQLTSPGRTSVVLSLAARITAAGSYCGWIDASDCLAPHSAEAAGVVLNRLFWVRCSEQARTKCALEDNRRPLNRVEQAFKAADILLQSSGFSLIVVDLGGLSDRLVRRVPLTTWYRFSRCVEKLPTGLVFITDRPYASSCARLVVRMSSVETIWNKSGDCAVPFTSFLHQHRVSVDISRSQRPGKKSPRPDRCSFVSTKTA